MALSNQCTAVGHQCTGDGGSNGRLWKFTLTEVSQLILRCEAHQSAWPRIREGFPSKSPICLELTVILLQIKLKSDFVQQRLRNGGVEDIWILQTVKWCDVRPGMGIWRYGDISLGMSDVRCQMPGHKMSDFTSHFRKPCYAWSIVLL